MLISEIVSMDTSNKKPFQHLFSKIDDGWFDPLEGTMIKDFSNILTKSKTNHYESAMIIASDNELFDAVDSYKYANTPFDKNTEQKLLHILSKTTPVDKTFYRGTDTQQYDDSHIMAVQSWSLSEQTAKMFGKYIWKTAGNVTGVEVANIYYWRNLLFSEGNGMGDAQAEWLLLPPKNKKLLNS